MVFPLPSHVQSQEVDTEGWLKKALKRTPKWAASCRAGSLWHYLGSQEG
jgi:hypothetical protein